MDWVLLHGPRVAGWVTYMSAAWGKMVRSVGDVTVPPFWLDLTVTSASGDERGLPH